MSDGTENLSKLTHTDFEHALLELSNRKFSPEQRIAELEKLRRLAPDSAARDRVSQLIRNIRGNRREYQSEY